MKRTDIFISKNSNINIDKLCKYKKTLRILPLPFDLTMFEIQDDYYEITHSEKPEIIQKIATDPVIHEGMRKQVQEFKEILLPLYPDKYTWAARYSLFIGANNYFFMDLKGKKIIRFDPIHSLMEKNEIIPIHLKIRKRNSKLDKKFYNVVEEWVNWGKINNFEINVIEFSAEESDLTIKVKFKSNLEDCLATLYWIFNESLGKSVINSISFNIVYNLN